MGTPARRRRSVAAAVAAIAVVLAIGPPASAQVQLWPWELVSHAGGDSPPSYGYSIDSHMSADGRLVVFDSDGDNLHPSARALRDVFLKDMDSGEMRLVSRVGLNGAGGDDYSHTGSITADGRHVGFGSFARNLHADDPDAWYDGYVKDLETGEIRLVTPSIAEGRTDGYRFTAPPKLSADGRYAVFTVGDFEGGPNGVYRRDLQTNELELVSQPSGNEWTRAEYHGQYAVSGDGRYVAFTSDEKLAPEDTDEPYPAKSDIYLRDMETDTTTLVSTSENVYFGYSSQPSISADGSRVAYVRQLQNGVNQAHVWDRETGQTEIASRLLKTSVLGNGHTENARISPDGTKLLFMSFATNLGHDLDDFSDMFLRDIETGVTRNISVLVPGDVPGRWHSGGAGDITPDNRYAVFSSGDRYLAPDAAGAGDVFRRRLIKFPPICLPEVRYAEAGSPVEIRLSCYDVDGEAISHEIVQAPSRGTLGAVRGGSVVYTPEEDWTGAVELKIRARDGGGVSETVSMLIVIGERPEPWRDPSPPPVDTPEENDGSYSPGTIWQGAFPGGVYIPGLTELATDTSPPPIPDLPPAPNAPTEPCSLPLVGSPSGDLLVGSSNHDRIRAGGGDDTVRGGRGHDCLSGGGGDDSLSGDAGDDRLEGDGGFDSHRGGSGDDSIKSADGRPETVDCGSGRDVATVDAKDRVRGCERVKRVRRAKR